MQAFFQLLVAGIAMGFIYCLIAIEYTLVWKATGLVNFAHEKFITLGAFFLGGTMIKLFPNNLPLAVLGTVVFMGLFGAVTSILVLNPLSKLPFRIFSVMGMLLLSTIMREALRLIWGAAPFTIQGFFAGTTKIGNIVTPTVNLYIISISIILLIAQALFFSKTKTGKAVRCVAIDKEVAALMGVNVKTNVCVSVAISSMLCGVIGMLVIPLVSISHTMAGSMALKGFCAGVVGGFGTYAGAIAGGLFVGILESLYLLIGPSTYKDVVAFGLLIIFLIIKPTGIISAKTNDSKKGFISSMFLGKSKKKGG